MVQIRPLIFCVAAALSAGGCVSGAFSMRAAHDVRFCPRSQRMWRFSAKRRKTIHALSTLDCIHHGDPPGSSDGLARV